MMTRKPARVILLKDARQKLNPEPPPRWNPFAALYRFRRALMAAGFAALAVIHFEKLPYSYLVVPASNKLIDYGITGAVAPRPEPIEGRFTTCAGAQRVNCVVDGDTFWYRAVKYRISDINTPEIGRPECETERRLGLEAQVALLDSLNSGGLTMERRERRDVDQYGRKLRVVLQDGRSVGDALVARGLAHRWEGQKLDWCG
ncbi:thermonuclease family protein [Rhizobium rhizophilum]|uniref:Thermonuclease family protein n=1 Tax=Rhizobium rhizophilum TaxID=1850373 RepID=A0ABY2QUB2_9HYPH|nr:thermonuclease family protein [Rhizobium rhizophilum]THV13791.1 thermonuclease family protein [Rhizobium rhizophilum]